MNLSVEDIAAGLKAGKIRALSRAITMAESTHPSQRAVITSLLERLKNANCDSIRLGISGPPGVGKSTFIEAFGREILNKFDKIAILAVDPSSSINHGSILADKTRMPTLAADPRAFIRPSPSGQTLGGVTRSTREAIALCEAAGYDIILIETVGVGQSEVSVESMVDCFVTLHLPNSGDDLQGMKKGILELSDMIVVTKADEAKPTHTTRAIADLKAAIQLVHGTSGRNRIPVLSCSSLEKKGIDTILETILQMITDHRKDGTFARRRIMQNVRWFEESLIGGMIDKLQEIGDFRQYRSLLIEKIKHSETMPSVALNDILNHIKIEFKS